MREGVLHATTLLTSLDRWAGTHGREWGIPASTQGHVLSRLERSNWSRQDFVLTFRQSRQAPLFGWVPHMTPRSLQGFQNLAAGGLSMFPIPHEAGYIAVPCVVTPSWTGPSLIPDGRLAPAGRLSPAKRNKNKDETNPSLA